MSAFLQLLADSGFAQLSPGQAVMIAVGLVLVILSISRDLEPLLLVPLGFAAATAFGILTAKVLNWLSPGQINPLIGAAGLAAVPHSPRAVQIEGRKANPDNFLIMHAMGPNLGAIIASSVVACVIYSLLGR